MTAVVDVASRRVLAHKTAITRRRADPDRGIRQHVGSRAIFDRETGTHQQAQVVAHQYSTFREYHFADQRFGMRRRRRGEYVNGVAILDSLAQFAGRPARNLQLDAALFAERTGDLVQRRAEAPGRINLNGTGRALRHAIKAPSKKNHRQHHGIGEQFAAIPTHRVDPNASQHDRGQNTRLDADSKYEKSNILCLSPRRPPPAVPTT